MLRQRVVLGLMVLSNAAVLSVAVAGTVRHTAPGGRPAFVPFFGALVLVTLVQNLAWTRRRERRRRLQAYGTADQPRLVPYDGARSGTTDPWSPPVEPGAQQS